MNFAIHRVFPKRAGFSLMLYGPALWTLWIAAFASCLALELIPAPGIPPMLFYLRLIAKAICFVLLGFATPLIIWRFDFLGFGLLIALLATTFVEFGQHMISGHRASYLECAAKLILICVGLVFGLNCRYDRSFVSGLFAVTFIDPHSHDLVK